MRHIICGSLMCLVAAPAWAGAPAKIKRAPESQLNQLELTPKAIERLGITVGPVSQEVLPQTLQVGGTIIPRPGSSALLRAPFSGTVEGPPGGGGLMMPGTKVRAGQTILRLRPLVAPNRNLLAETQRDLDQAKARLDLANKASTRATQLLAEGAGDQAAVELAQQNTAVAEAELRAAKERLQQARRDPLGADVSLPLRAPREGLVLSLIAASGQTVEQGAALVEVVSPEDLWVRVPLYVGRIERVQRDASARIQGLGRKGKTAEAEPVPAMPVPSINGTVADLMYALPSNAPFRPGARVTVRLLLQGATAPVSVLPGSAVFYDSQGAAWVYAQVAEQTFERRRIEVDTVVEDKVILKRGPAKGTQVVLVGAMELFGTEFGIGK